MSKVKIQQFEIGKCYQHTTGREIKVIARAETTAYGSTLIAENAFAKPLPDIEPTADDQTITSKIGYIHQDFSAVGDGHEHASNWFEITEEQWMKNFSPGLLG